MRCRYLIGVVPAVFSMVISGVVDAKGSVGQFLDGDGECKVHEYTDGEIIRVEVAPFANLHIRMHTNVYAVIMGGGRMWHGRYIQENPLPHIWVKAKTEEGYNGQTTTMTVLDENMGAYNFVLNRRKSPGYTCVVIKPDPQQEFQARLENWKSPAQRQVSFANERVAQAQRNADIRVEAVKEHAAEQIKHQRAKLYTDYVWTEESSSFTGESKDLVRSVMDDGLFTYVTLNNTSSGLMSIYGIYGGKEHQVDMNYDPQLMQYTVTGVFNEIRMRYQDSTVTIQRRGR